MFKKLLISTTLLTYSICLFSQTYFWKKANSVPAGLGTQYIKPEKSSTFSVDFISMKNAMQQLAPMENTGHGLTISLPTPEGNSETFEIWKYSMMAPGLQSQFPEIGTYLGRSESVASRTIRIDHTYQGFHAMVEGIGGSWYIDPIYLNETQYYQVYYKADLVNTKLFSCGETSIENDEAEPHIVKTILPNGTQLKTYRLAVAATGEYTAFHGGTVANALSAQVTTMNRVNGLYEKDLSVRMEIVANNNLLIYTNANSDPYSNNDGGTMLGQNQTNVNNVIGSANYDIGHVFSTGGGGIASLGSVCTSRKAQGVTGSGAPVGDPFDIDYVAHEMGHQFGANHTFNSTIGSCGGGNRSSNNAYEPGSGVTIMAYAGICGADNLASNSIDNFHTASYNAIRAFITTGDGNSCDVPTNTNNNVPLVDAGPSIYRIPLRTPFRMTAVGSGIESGEQATYSWEEYDLGNSVALATNATSGTHPLFRPYSPDTSNIRVFPRMQTIVNNGTDNKEKLPTYARRLRFRVMIRDNRANGGAASLDSTTIWAAANTGPFLVSSPNTFLTWVSGTTQNVTWSVANTNTAPVNCQNVNIKLSTDGGYTYPTTLLANTPNDGSANITVPNLGAVPITTCRVMVEAADNIFFDISNANFTIQSAPEVIPTASFTVSSAGVICAGKTLNFSDQSTNTPSTWAWTFQGGNPATSSTQNQANVSFPSAGTYTVTLTVSNSAGSNTSSQTVTVNELPTATFDITPANAGQSNGSAVALVENGTAPYTIQWATNPPQTGASANNLPSGNNIVNITDANGCFVVYTVSVPITGNASISEMDVFGMNFFPNPTQNIITLSVSTVGNYTYQLYDAAGRTVSNGSFAGTSHSFDLSTLSSGVYSFKLSDGKRSSTKRILKN
jgi:PKD repeat protein